MFIIYPAIDLRKGQVVRLREGNPDDQTTYSNDSAKISLQWIQCGAAWIHVVNLDGALDESDSANLTALGRILNQTSQHHIAVQFGGGLRSIEAIKKVLDLGVTRAILGTVVIENRYIVQEALREFTAARIAVSLDSKDGVVRTHGWKTQTTIRTIDLAQELREIGLQTLIFTDISRDGKQTGINLQATQNLVRQTKLNIIASGGVQNMQDILQARHANLAGIIVGKALYENNIDLKQAILQAQELT